MEEDMLCAIAAVLSSAAIVLGVITLLVNRRTRHILERTSRDFSS